MDPDMSGGMDMGGGDMDMGGGDMDMGGGDMDMGGGDMDMGGGGGANSTAGGGDANSTAGGGDHSMMGHQMSPFLFIRTTGFFVLFKEANIQSTGAFVGALILSFIFALLSTMLSLVIRSMEERTLAGSKGAMKFITGLQHGFRTFLHYVAMLIVMTMNVWLIVAVVAGHALGWTVYALAIHRTLKDGANKAACDC
ncbi:Ctr copper transporter [Gracilaria domingensis]|nr:Ctr copper transporter [Gracilaria domingensis]